MPEICSECGHVKLNPWRGYCQHEVSAFGKRPVRYCGCKCVFPAPPEVVEQVKAENCKPAGDCANCGAPIVEAFAPGIGDYWYHVRGLAYCDTDNPSFDRTATPQWLAEEEASKTSVPASVPAEAAANYIHLPQYPMNGTQLECDGSELRPDGTCAKCERINDRIEAHYTKLSTATNSAAVEAARLAAREIFRYLETARPHPTSPEWNSVNVTATGKTVLEDAVVAIISHHFPLTEAAGAITDLRSLRQQVEDTVLVAQTEEDSDGFITAYHFKTGAIHRLLAEARK